MSRLLLGSTPADLPSDPAEAVDPDHAPRGPEKSATATRPRALGLPTPRAPAIYIWALIAFVVLEFARPPVVSGLKLQFVISIALPPLVAFSKLRWWHPIMTIYTALFVLAAIHVPLAYNNYSAYMFARSAFSGAGIAMCICWILPRLPEIRIGLLAWIMSLSYVAFFGITHGGTGPSGFMGDENDMALACCTAFPFAFFGFERLTGWKRWVAGGLAVVFVVAIVVSFSRGGFVGLAAVGLYCFYFSRRKGRNILIGLAAILAFLVFAPAEYLDEIKTIQDTEEGTAESRRFLWEAGFNMWKDNPVIGVGGGGSNWLVGKYQPTDPKYDHPSYRERDWSGQALHSLYFQLLSELGTVGVLLYGGMIYLHFRVLNRLRRFVAGRTRKNDPLRRETELYAGCLAGAMVGFLVPALFISVLSYPYVWYLSAFALALDRAVRSALDQRESASRPREPVLPAAGVLEPTSA